MSNANNQSEIMVQLMNRLFDMLSKKKIKSLSELTNEKLLKHLLLEIEPNLEANGNKIELTDDQNFGIRYGNIISIISAVEKYKSQSPEKDRFTLNTNFKKIIIVNDLLKNDKDQLQLLAEMILFLSAISSKKDIYIDRISEIDDTKLFNLFFQVIDKYMILERNDDTINQSHLEKSYIISTQITKMKDEYEKQIANLIAMIKENEAKINTLQNRNDQLEKTNGELDMKLKDKERELEMIKSTQTQNFKYQEQLYKDSLASSELINQLNQKEIEINDLKNELTAQRKKYNEDVSAYKSKNEILEEKLKEIKTVQAKYEKLNQKYKEINSNTSNLSNGRNEKAREFLTKENQNLQSQIDKLLKEALSEKDRYFRSEEERKRLERVIAELRQENSSLTNKISSMNSCFNMNNISAVQNVNDKDNKEGFELANDSFLNDLKVRNTDKEAADLRNEKNELMKLYKTQGEELSAATKEKEQFKAENESKKMEIEKLKQKVEKAEIEKEKVELQIQKNDLNYQKLKIEFEKAVNEKKEIEKSIKENSTHYKKEIEQLKTEINSHKNLNEKMLNEKKTLINDYKSLQKEYEKYRTENSNSLGGSHPKLGKGKATKGGAGKEGAVIQNTQSDAEVIQLKSEIQNLKLQNIQKEEIIKNLKTENEEKDKTEDLDFYKKSYEEQKIRVNEEHKLISESLYKLAVHFMSLKDDLQKKINNNNK